ncbi:GNAT family N-acetyltransferase [Deinococcus sp. KNUC1210]|uniref:GNAT family N-acetyltransferase n=1 Tax=Deinococcus sp. KNUC1210 TaxID=2917691 RepID=UPI001EEF8EDB|nr:GNAT family N-acetyltransferase [Deinococcus sp. KNUC1210]ULH14902.1 GNAT family N-acetyltransferase [Deinococcus sp. KNUC1210]
MTVPFHSRHFADADAPAVAALVSRLYPDRAVSATELLNFDRDQQNAGSRHARFLALTPGEELAGFAAYSQSLGQFHPRRFRLELIVAPEWRQQGIGAALYAWAETQLLALDVLVLRSDVSEADEAAQRFARQRGFAEERRTWVSSLDVTHFDDAPYAGLEARLLAGGLQLLSAADLARQHPDDWHARMHTLFSEVRLDVPRTDPATPISLEQYREWILDDPGFLPQAFVLAQTLGGELVGQSDLYRSQNSRDLFIGLTGVKRAWRGLGLATALKLRGVQYAQAQGVTRIWTDNESSNAPMLRVNERLGFVREPARLSMVRHWPDL